MARKPRIEYEGAFYHVIVRGNQKQKVFKDRLDFLKYLEFLTGYKERHHYNLYSYVLMSNHVHLLIETREIPLSKVMQGINQSYTMYFNRRYKTAGHLFQGRYKAILCDRDAYLLTLIKYIHLNPIRARIVKEIGDYQWSSHHNYVKQKKESNIVDNDRVLRMFSEYESVARKLYKTFMGDEISIKKEDIYRTIDQRILGEDKFIDEVMEKYEGELKKEKRGKEYSLPEIAKAIEKINGVTLKQIRGHSKAKEISSGRKLLSIVAKEYGYRGREIAQYIRRDPAVVSIALKEGKQMMKKMEKTIKCLNEI